MAVGNQMNQDVTKSDLSIAIHLFKRYLHNQKKKGDVYLNISKSSQSVMDNWGTSLQSTQVQFKSPFYFEGSKTADVFIIDSQGSFFKNESGDLLTKILKAMNLVPGSVYICNAESLQSINETLLESSPKIIIALGSKATKLLSNTNKPIQDYRGKLFDFLDTQVMPTYHPSRLLKDPGLKRHVWEDMKVVMKCLGQNRGS